MLRKVKAAVRLLVKPSNPYSTANNPYWIANTLAARSPEDFTDRYPAFINGMLPEMTAPGSTLFAALTQNLPVELLMQTITMLRKRCVATESHLVACLSDAIPCYTTDDTRGKREPTEGLALARFRPGDGTQIVPFRSVLHGRPSIALGRQVQQGKERDFSFPSKHISDEFQSAWGAQEDSIPQLPPELRDLDPLRIKGLWFFSDDEPEGLLASFDQHLPDATKVGLIAASTPFVTGRPFSMFTETESYEAGAIGLALCSVQQPKLSIGDVRCPSVRVISKFMKVTEARGNIITSLDGRPAAQVLLESMEEFNVKKGSELFLHRSNPRIRGGRLSVSLHRILSGDHSRGLIAVDTEDPIPLGTEIIIKAWYPGTVSQLHMHPGFGVFGTPEARHHFTEPVEDCGKWVAASSNGFVASSVEHSRVCKITGSSGRLYLRSAE